MMYNIFVSVRVLKRGNEKDEVLTTSEVCRGLGEVEEAIDTYAMMVANTNDEDTLAEAELKVVDIMHDEECLYYINQLGIVQKMDEHGNLYDIDDNIVGCMTRIEQ